MMISMTTVSVNASVTSSPVGEQNIVMSGFVCLSVCLWEYLRNHTSRLYQTFCDCLFCSPHSCVCFLCVLFDFICDLCLHLVPYLWWLAFVCCNIIKLTYIAVVGCSSGCVAICYVITVLYKMSCFSVMRFVVTWHITAALSTVNTSTAR